MRFAFLFMMFASVLLYAETKKIVIDLTTGDMENFKSRFLSGVPASIEYFQSNGDRVETAVVVHGKAYKFFVEKLENTQFGVDENLTQQQAMIHQRLEEIVKKYGVRIDVCQVGMNRHGILREDLYPFATPVKSAMVGLIKWQNAGYAYIPVN